MSSITLRFLAEPNTVNFGGKVHGGTIMKWIDEAGYACAMRWAKHYCVTVSVGSIRFQKPILTWRALRSPGPEPAVRTL